MTSTGRLREEITNRLDSGSLVALGVVVWLSIEVFDTGPARFAATLAGSAITGAAGLVADAYDLRDGVRQGGLGLASVFGALVLVAAGGSGALSVVLGLVGAWFVADGAQALRHAGIDAPDETTPDGETVYRQYLRRRTRELLGERSMTRGQLHQAMDADPDVVDAVLAELRLRDLVTLEAGVFRRTSPERPGRLTRVRNAIGRGIRRIARPLTVEFRNDDPYAEESVAGAESGQRIRNSGDHGGENERSVSAERRERERGR
jgi:hypothetical protein